MFSEADKLYQRAVGIVDSKIKIQRIYVAIKIFFYVNAFIRFKNPAK